MKRSKVYRMAAKLVAQDPSPDGRASCLAICDVVGGWGQEADDYNLLFAPKNAQTIWGVQWGSFESEVKPCRILALCFMAAIAEDEES